VTVTLTCACTVCISGSSSSDDESRADIDRIMAPPATNPPPSDSASLISISRSTRAPTAAA
jgi:hypothetical protein